MVNCLCINDIKLYFVYCIESDYVMECVGTLYGVGAYKIGGDQSGALCQKVNDN